MTTKNGPWTINSTNKQGINEKYSFIFFIGKVEREGGLRGYIISVGPFYWVFNIVK